MALYMFLDLTVRVLLPMISTMTLILLSLQMKRIIFQLGIFIWKKNQYNESNGTTLFTLDSGTIIANVSFVPAVATLSTFDYDNDGDSDIIVSTSTIVYVLINKRNHFQALDIGYCKKTESTNYIDIQPMYRVGLACGYFNNDGFTDFCLGTSDGFLRLFLNNYQEHWILLIISLLFHNVSTNIFEKPCIKYDV